MASVPEHYNALARNTLSKRQRRALPTYPLREFNNTMKRALIGQAQVPPGCRILDLCSGRGGDIFKYAALQPAFVHFIDISTTSIAEATRRYNTGRSQGDITYEAAFSVMNCFDPATPNSLAELLATEQPQFDVVFCFFALHYAMESQATLQTLLHNVTVALRPGGYFICTFPHYKSIQARATATQPATNNELPAQVEKNWQTPWKSFGNSIMHVEFSPTAPIVVTEATSQGFGAAYKFTLEDAVSELTEYLVPPDLLTFHLGSFGLRTLLHCGFLEAAVHLRLLGEYPTDPEQMDVASLYACLVCIREHAPPPPHQSNSTNTINSRGVLQEYCQQRGYPLPVYKEWPVHDWRMWMCTVSVLVSGRELTAASTPQPTKKLAQQEAAAAMLNTMNTCNSLTVQDVTHESISHESISHESILQPDPQMCINPCNSSNAELIVHIDADHISFVTPDMVRVFPTVFFSFYHGFGAHLGHLQPFIDTPASYPNVSIAHAPSPLKNLTDSMILVASTKHVTTRPGVPQVVVSRDATVYHASVLLENTFCVTTKQQVNDILNSELGVV